MPVRSTVHPRVRGEHDRLLDRKVEGDGSSPRARGTFVNGLFRERYRRFIPACAGNIPLCDARRRLLAVHPRVRGEHLYGGSVNTISAGSSPRARGTSSNANDFPVQTAVHPRVRGEHGCNRKRMDWDRGSSPRARGTSGWGRDTRTRNPVHPRVRGEHSHTMAVINRDFGSSPRARGTLFG